MTWEWLAPTTAVGMAGIAATWLTARASRIDQRNMVLVQYEQAEKATLREKRREAYARLIADLYSMFHSAAFPHIPDRSEDLSLVHDLSRSRAEARILGRDAVRQLAEQLVPQVLRYTASVLEKEREDDDCRKMRKGLNGQLYVLERLMASDLGIPVTDPPRRVEKED